VGRGIKRWSASVVCLSDVAYIGPNAKTKRPRKMKLGTGVPQVTCDSHTDFKVQRAQFKVTGSVGTPQRNVPIFRKRIKLRYSNLARTYDVGSSCPGPKLQGYSRNYLNECHTDLHSVLVCCSWISNVLAVHDCVRQVMLITALFNKLWI